MSNNENLYALLVWYFIVSGVFAVILMVFIYLLIVDNPVKYDCTIAEFSPDFTQKMKEECLEKKIN
jgi:hypothetical protein